jgi:hypothetical protein
MNESRKSKRRRKAARQAREWSRARRLSIEAMEGRVLLSGSTADLSAFVADLTPASYAPPVAQSGSFTLPEISSRCLIAPLAGQGEGGHTDAVTAHIPPNYPDSVFKDGVSSADSLGNFGNDVHVDTTCVTDSTAVLYGAAGGPDVVVGKKTTWIEVTNLDQSMLVHPLSLQTITPSWNFELLRVTPGLQEGGEISVVSIRTEFMSSSLAQSVRSSVAETSGEGESAAGESRGLVASKSQASTPIEGEWARAIAMESVSTTGSVVPNDHTPSRDTSSSPAATTRGNGPLSSVDAQTHEGRGRADLTVASNQFDVPVDSLSGAPLSSDHAAASPRVTSVAWMSTGSETREGIALVPAHRLDASGRGVRKAMNQPSAANLARDEAYSEWHLGLAADADVDSSGQSEHWLWVTPGPFLAVLALERFVSLEPREKEQRRNGSHSLR